MSLAFVLCVVKVITVQKKKVIISPVLSYLLNHVQLLLSNTFCAAQCYL
jgi:hypothetical protein